MPITKLYADSKFIGLGVRRYRELSGYVTEQGAPAQNLLLILDNQTNVIIGAVLSRADTGYWRFVMPVFRYKEDEWERRFLVCCRDLDGVYNAKVYDFLTPVLVEEQWQEE